MTEKMTKQEMANLRAKGWDFVPTGPDEYSWIKFDAEGNYLAQGLQPVFFEDMK